jgi:hypothetical protein
MFPPKEMKAWIEKVSAQRMEICNSCPMISTKHSSIRPDVHCTDCGCTLSAKTRCLSCSCPLPIPLWEAVLESLDEEHIIKKAIGYEE